MMKLGGGARPNCDIANSPYHIELGRESMSDNVSQGSS